MESSTLFPGVLLAGSTTPAEDPSLVLLPTGRKGPCDRDFRGPPFWALAQLVLLQSVKGAGGGFPTRTKTLRCRAVTQLDQGSQWVSDTGRPPSQTHCAFRDTAATEPLHKPSGKVPGVWAPCWGLLDPSGPAHPGRAGVSRCSSSLGDHSCFLTSDLKEGN